MWTLLICILGSSSVVSCRPDVSADVTDDVTFDNTYVRDKDTYTQNGVIDYVITHDTITPETVTTAGQEVLTTDKSNNVLQATGIPAYHDQLRVPRPQIFDTVLGVFAAGQMALLAGAHSAADCREMCREMTGCRGVNYLTAPVPQCLANTDDPTQLVHVTNWTHYKLVPDVLPYVLFHTDMGPGTVCHRQGERVLWTRVWVNEGSGMRENGTFVCPYTGLYEITVSLYAHSKGLYYAIKRDDEWVAFVETRGDHGSYTTLTRCAAGQAIYVESLGGTTSCLVGSCCGSNNMVGKLLKLDRVSED